MTDHSPSARLGWIERLPVGWEPRRIKHGTYVKGRIGWHGLKSTDFRDTGAYLVTGTDFLLGKLDWSRMRRVDESFYLRDPYIQLRIGDLLLTKDGTIGKVAVVDDLPGPATLNSGLFVIRPEGRTFDNRFMYWVLSSRLLADFIDYRGMGTTITHLYQGTFLEMPYPRPPLEAQRRIADFLDRETARIDELVDKKIRLIELLEEKRTALITQAVSKGLNPLVPMKSSGIPSLGQFPQHWRRKRLKQVIRRLIDAEHKTVHFVENGDYPVIRTSDVRRGRMHIDQARRTDAEGYAEWTRRGQPRPGDVLFSREAPVGEAALVPEHPPVCLGQRMVLIRTRQAELRSSLLVHWLYTPVVSEFIDLASQGSTVRHLNMRDIPNIPVVVPPISEQAEIADRCEWIDTRLKALEEKLSLQLNLLAEYRQALITAAVTGQMDLSLRQSEPEQAIA